MHWQEVTDSVWLYEDSCNVYAVRGSAGVVVINAGSGRWLDRLDELPDRVAAVLCTHFFRDHSAGAALAAERGIEVLAPYWEKEQFADPLGLFQRRETYIIYDNTWDLFAPIQPIEVSRWMRDWETFDVAGLSFQVLPTPGVTLGAVSLLCKSEDQKVAFCGEVIHSPGKIARIAPLQYNYNDLPGAVNLIYSLRLLKEAKPDLLAPSLGAPIGNGEQDGTAEALSLLEENLRFAIAGRPECEPFMQYLDEDPLLKVSEHVYQSRAGGASTWFLLSESGKVLSIDYGYHSHHSFGAGYPYPRNRRSLLHGIKALEQKFGIKGIDVVLVTHFHDDHVNGIPLLQRLFGTTCWAGENFAPILADPASFNFPCTWPEPIAVEPKPLGTPIEWEEYTFVLHPMSGHTRWSTLVEFDVDGMRAIATGDQYFFEEFAAPGETPVKHNHVYRNGAVLASFSDSNKLLKSIKPDLVLPGHGTAYRTNELFLSELEQYGRDYVELHSRLMPLGEQDVHFDVDSRAGWLEPYRVHRVQASPITFRAHVRNPLGDSAVLSLKMVVPKGWKDCSKKIQVGAREEAVAELSVSPPEDARCRRQPVALELCAGDRCFGQIAEALVTLGHPVF